MEIKKSPIIFEPYLKIVIWGGEKIKEYKGIDCNLNKIGESWEISGVPGHVSKVAEGPYKGKNLNDLIDLFGEQLLGKKVMEKYGKQFPLLIKIIDAADNLSVQVHPDDELAKERHNSLGKTEMWYIISAEKDAKIYSGLKEQLNPEEYTKRIENGTFAETLAVYDSAPGDIFFLPAGRVHAIGAGNLLAEIQETSDITYRIYDYDRKDADGNTRELHTKLAKDAIDYTVHPNYKSELPLEGKEEAEIVDCDHFRTSLMNLNGSLEIPLSQDSFHILIGIEGEFELTYSEGNMQLHQGWSVLLPAAMDSIKITGKGKMLLTSSN